jgi:hypothetical protein
MFPSPALGLTNSTGTTLDHTAQLTAPPGRPAALPELKARYRWTPEQHRPAKTRSRPRN